MKGKVEYLIYSNRFSPKNNLTYQPLLILKIDGTEIKMCLVSIVVNFKMETFLSQM